MIKSGRNGAVKWDPTGAGGVTAVELMSIKSFQLSLATEKINVSCFGDQNRVYIPGLRDISGSLGGFWNSEDMSLIEATELTAPGFLELIPDTTDGTPAPFGFSGKAYLDAEINTDVEGAPEMTGTFMAADTWTLPASAAALAARGQRPGRAARNAGGAIRRALFKGITLRGPARRNQLRISARGRASLLGNHAGWGQQAMDASGGYRARR